MRAFLRALHGEIYVTTHRRPVRWAHLAVFAMAVAHAGVNRLLLGLQYGEEAGFGVAGEWNFWPQFAGAVRGATFLVELLVAVLVASTLPREIAVGAVRDPLSRRLSRIHFLTAKAVVALLLPITLYLCAVGGGALGAGLLFEAGDSMEDGIVRFDEQEDIIPVVRHALWHGVLPLLALACGALAFSVICSRVTAAVGLTLGFLFVPLMAGGMMGSRAPWFFADVLPAFGPDSFLQVAARWSAGYNDAYPASYDHVVATGWISPLPAIGVFLLVSLLLFHRRKL